MKLFLKKMTPAFIKYLYHFILRRYRLYKSDQRKKAIIKCLKDIPKDEITDEQKEVLAYLKHHRLAYFPYLFTQKYKSQNVVVYTDDKINMKYVLQDNKRLYFKRDWDEVKIRN
jgi:hypothetical protein